MRRRAGRHLDILIRVEEFMRAYFVQIQFEDARGWVDGETVNPGIVFAGYPVVDGFFAIDIATELHHPGGDLRCPLQLEIKHERWGAEFRHADEQALLRPKRPRPTTAKGPRRLQPPRSSGRAGRG